MANQINKWLDQAQRHGASGHTEDAEKLCRKILQAVPGHAGAQLELGRALYFRRHLHEAIGILESLLEQEPNNSDARILLVYSHMESGGHAQAAALAHDIDAHSHDPSELVAAYLAFDTVCDWESARRMQPRILDMASRGQVDNVLMSSLLMVLNAAPGIPADRMYELHKVWGDRVHAGSKRLGEKRDALRPRDGKLRIGYLSADFNQHPVGHFIQSVIAHHDHDRFETYCYAHLAKDDARTGCIRDAADHFTDVTQLSSEEIARRIQNDGIHVLVDLGGHTALSRLDVLAFKPAPVQITYLGYPNTTGLSTVDFRLTDAYAEDLEHGTRYTEELLCMPRSFLCATEFMQDVTRVETTPAAKNGYITFGSFNNVRKLNPETIALWSAILHRTEGSRLVIKSKGCDVPEIRANLLKEFARHQIEADRIQFHAPTPQYADHVAIFNQVDIALDSFPYNGTTTTCETLWIGVPLVTLVGNQHAQRTSYSILKNIGLDATIAYTPEEYVEKAVNLARNIDGLSVLRKCLPTLLQHSPLGQPEAFTRQIEGLYLDAWQAKGFEPLPSPASAESVPASPVQPPLPGTKAQRRLLLCDRLDPLAWHVLRTHCDAVAAGTNQSWLLVFVPEVDQKRRIRDNIARYLTLNYAKLNLPFNVYLSMAGEEIDLQALLHQTDSFYVMPDTGAGAAHQTRLRDAASDCGCKPVETSYAPVQADMDVVEKQPSLADFKVTVCVPTFNRRHLLERTVQSVLDQRYGDFELLISDNASSDDTEAYCRELAARDSRVRYHRNAANIGAAGNFLQLYEMVETDLFVFCSDDDFLEPEHLLRITDLMRRKPELGMAYGQCYVVDMQGQVINNLNFTNTVDCVVDPRHELLESFLRNQIVWTSAMFRKSTVERMRAMAEKAFGLSLKDIIQATDYMFGVLMLTQAPAGYVDIPTANFSINPVSWSSTLLDRGLGEEVDVLGCLYDLYDRCFGMDATAKRALRAGILLRSERLQATLEQVSALPESEQHDMLQNIRAVSDQLNVLMEKATRTAATGQQAEDTPLSPEDWTRHVTAALQAYKERQDDEGVQAQLRALRAIFVQTWLAAATNDPESAFAPFREGYRALLFSGFRYETPVDDETVLIRELLDRLQAQPEVQHDIPARLAAMLYSQPHQLPLCTEPERLPAWFLGIHLDFMHTIPELFRQPGETERYLQTMQSWVDALHRGVTSGEASAWKEIAAHFTLKANFIPIYMTSDNLKDIYVKRAEIMAAYLEMQGNRLEHEFAARPASRQKIRLGILANHFMPQTETFAAIPFFEHLDRSRFEITLLSMAETGHRLERYCRQRADRFIHLQASVPECVQRIRALDLDMLLVASNVTAVCNHVALLAEHRLARVQLASVASCVTTGMRHVDYYLSGSYTEPAQDAQAHYREQLLTLEGPVHCYNFATEDEAPTLAVTRQQLGIPDDAVVYTSGSNYYKIIPEVEEAWADILANVPNAYLLLYPFNPNWSNAYATRPFIARLMSAFRRHGVPAERIVILQPLERQADIKAILALTDIYLDSFPFSGVTSLLDPLAVGVPPIAMHGDNFRTMMAESLLHELDTRELIADGIDAYLELAVRLGREEPLRRSLRAKISAGMKASPRFLDSRGYGRNVERLLLELAAERLGTARIEDTEPCV